VVAPEQTVPTFEIEHLDVDEDCPMVRVTNFWASTQFRDWLTLFNRDGNWQIGDKLYRVID
jgi:hypothetical protein